MSRAEAARLMDREEAQTVRGRGGAERCEVSRVAGGRAGDGRPPAEGEAGGDSLLDGGGEGRVVEWVGGGGVENGGIEQGKHAGDGWKGDGGNVGGCQWMAAVQVEAEMERWEEERGRLEEVKGRLEHFHSQVGGGTGGQGAGSIDGRLGQGWRDYCRLGVRPGWQTGA